ncbi:MAG: DUF3500 domain-containing protein [Dehalococcoidia bacterium]
MSETLQERMASAADGLLDLLDSDQRARAMHPFEEGGERELWFYTPTDHGGLSMRDMTSVQQRELHRLLTTGLSQRGYVTTATIMGLENILDAHEGFLWPIRDGYRQRDPLGYAVSFFGEPGGKDPWGWRFGGHHISLNYFVAPEGVRVLPSFFGSDRTMHQGTGLNMLRPLGAEEDLGRELVHLLTPEQLQRTVISPVAPPDIVTSNRPRFEDGDTARPFTEIWRGESRNPAGSNTGFARIVEFLGLTDEHLALVAYTDRPKGIALADMTDEQRRTARAVLNQYIDRMPDEIAEQELARVDASTDLHFAWAGGIDAGLPHYYRFQGTGLLVEYDNTQSQANHIHSVWRDPRRDFGRDVLAEHYAQAHGAHAGRH